MKSSPAQNLAKLLAASKLLETVSRAGVDVVAADLIQDSLNNLEVVIHHMQTEEIRPDQKLLQEVGFIITKHRYLGREDDEEQN